jgi:hypothetical protein
MQPVTVTTRQRLAARTDPSDGSQTVHLGQRAAGRVSQLVLRAQQAD